MSCLTITDNTPKRTTCPHCSGEGFVYLTPFDRETCHVCLGSRTIPDSPIATHTPKVCPVSKIANGWTYLPQRRRYRFKA